MKKSKKTITFISIFFALFCLGLIIFTKNGSKGLKKDDQKIEIIATNDTYSEIAKKVAGKHGIAKPVIDNPNIDPHEFKPSNKTATLISKADLVVCNGLGYDDWIDPLVGKNKLLNIGSDVAKLKKGANPHLWFDYQLMGKYAEKVAIKLGEIKPKEKQYFLDNAHQYQNELKQLDKQVENLKSTQKESLVDVSEPLFDYALSKLNYKINNRNFAEAIEKETDPSIKDTDAMIDDFKNRRIAFYVQNKQVENNTTKMLLKAAKENNIPVLYLTETKPNKISYIEWQKNIYNDLAKILKK